MSLSFEEILNHDSSEIERPKPLPRGTYDTVIKSFELKRSPKEQIPFIEFVLQIRGPIEVEEDELTTYGSVVGKTIRATFWFRDSSKEELDRSRFYLSKFLDAAKVDSGKGISLDDRLQASVNCRVGANVRHKPSPDGSEIYAEFARGVEL